MKYRFLIFLQIFLGVQCVFAQTPSQLILNRYAYFLLKDEPAAPAEADSLITKLNKGQWIDLDYASSAPTDDWQLKKHLDRLLILTKVWANTKFAYYHQPRLKQSIDAALNHWLAKRYKNKNWWHNEIGTPQYFKDLIILLKDSLSEKQLSNSLEVLAQHNVNGTGANMVWSADLGFHYGLLTGNDSLMTRCSKLIANEIKVSTMEGIQPDYSFHQHGPRLQTYHYGSSFLNINVRLAWELRETKWALPAEKVNILNNYVLNGWQWMARGINTVPGTLDRSVSRPGRLKYADIRTLIPYLTELSPRYSQQFQQIEASQNDTGKALAGFRHFPYSDFTAYHTSEYSFFLKTISSRTLPSESINNENLKGGLLNNGDTYLVKDGQEYYDLMPVWDWQHLPGITNSSDSLTISRQAFAGAVSDGKSGLTAMDYKLEGNGKSISAHKIWAVHNGIILYLMSDINNIGTGEIFTTLDQCRLRGPVTVNSAGNIIPMGSNLTEGVKWIHHSGFGYIPLNPSQVKLNLNRVNGSWAAINSSGSKDLISEEVFMPVLNHSSSENSTGYAIAACSTPQDAALLANKPQWKILRNDKACNAVAFNDGTIMAALFAAGKVKAGKRLIEANRPCLIMLTGNKVFVSDPLHQGGKLELKINRKKREVNLPEDGTIVTVTIK